ncbi:MAG: DUF3341 domain-containing protein [Chthonomonas sp.]|nr:DUF3341 domain-containing protein [Chthonomonas sp.]
MSAHAETVDLLYGVCAEFNAPGDLIRAAEKAREAGFTEMDCFSPFPIHGLTDAMKFHDVKVPWTIFGAGFLGGLTGLALQYITSVYTYRHNVGGRPAFSWPSFIPVTYECTILCAGLAAVFGMAAFNGLPKPYHPVFSAPNFDRASQDKFFLCLENHDGFDAAKAEALLKSTNAVNVARVDAEEAGNWSQ